jgi:hypothetical protein
MHLGCGSLVDSDPQSALDVADPLLKDTRLPRPLSLHSPVVNVGGASHLSRPPISLPSPAPGPSGRPSPPRRDCRSASERPARALGSSAWGARNPLLGLGRQTETPAPAGAVHADGGSGGREDRGRRRLGGEPERREEPAHGVGLRHRAQDPPPAPAAVAHQHLKPEHALEQDEWKRRKG